MLTDRRIIKLAEQLNKISPCVNWPLGTMIARGFADIGHEEFLYVYGEKIVSLLTGDAKVLDINERLHFFPVFDLDSLVHRAHEIGVDLRILHLSHQDQEWIVTCAIGEATCEKRGPELLPVMYQLVIESLGEVAQLAVRRELHTV